jgi:hypothetical protein
VASLAKGLVPDGINQVDLDLNLISASLLGLIFQAPVTSNNYYSTNGPRPCCPAIWPTTTVHPSAIKPLPGECRGGVESTRVLSRDMGQREPKGEGNEGYPVSLPRGRR